LKARNEEAPEESDETDRPDDPERACGLTRDWCRRPVTLREVGERGETVRFDRQKQVGDRTSG